MGTSTLSCSTSKFSYFQFKTTGSANGGYDHSYQNHGTMYIGAKASSGTNAGVNCGSFGALLYNLSNRTSISKINSVKFSIKTKNDTSGYNDCVARIEYIGKAYNNYPPEWRVGGSSETISLKEGSTTSLETSDFTTCSNFLNIIQNAASGEYHYFRIVRESGQGAVLETAITLTITYEEGGGGSYSFNGATPYIWKATPTQYKYPEAAMTSNNSQNCVASESSWYEDEYDRRAYWCFDLSNKTTAWWSASNAYEPWVQLVMPRALYNIKVTLTNRDVDYARGLITGGIYGTNDGDKTTLTLLESISGRDGNTAAASTTHSCGNTSVAYNTVRVKFTKWGANADGDTYFASLGEIEITGTDVPSGGGWLKATPYVYNDGWQVATANVAG